MPMRLSVLVIALLCSYALWTSQTFVDTFES